MNFTVNPTILSSIMLVLEPAHPCKKACYDFVNRLLSANLNSWTIEACRPHMLTRADLAVTLAASKELYIQPFLQENLEVDIIQPHVKKKYQEHVRLNFSLFIKTQKHDCVLAFKCLIEAFDYISSDVSLFSYFSGSFNFGSMADDSESANNAAVMRAGLVRAAAQMASEDADWPPQFGYPQQPHRGIHPTMSSPLQYPAQAPTFQQQPWSPQQPPSWHQQAQNPAFQKPPAPKVSETNAEETKEKTQLKQSQLEMLNKAVIDLTKSVQGMFTELNDQKKEIFALKARLSLDAPKPPPMAKPKRVFLKKDPEA